MNSLELGTQTKNFSIFLANKYWPVCQNSIPCFQRNILPKRVCRKKLESSNLLMTLEEQFSNFEQVFLAGFSKQNSTYPSEQAGKMKFLTKLIVLSVFLLLSEQFWEFKQLIFSRLFKNTFYRCAEDFFWGKISTKSENT